ncbi:hypothetical protein [Halovenus sp. HT40]|uniref:hypothetical protein n=1 Tax=Halovenus sp. HT40 TaxID=3126691 RepID=UPI00300EC3DC
MPKLDNDGSNNPVELDDLEMDELKTLRDQITAEIEHRQTAQAGDPAEVVDIYMEDAVDHFRGKTKSSKSPEVGPAKTVHNGIPVFVCYKADTSKKNSTSRWVKINDDWIWESDRVVADEEQYGDTEYPYSSKLSVFAADLEVGDTVEIHNKRTHGSGSTRRSTYEWDGTSFESI